MRKWWKPSDWYEWGRQGWQLRWQQWRQQRRLPSGGRLCAPSVRNTSAAQRQGALWERHAQTYLERRGLKLLAANFRCPGGEIDLIMCDRATIVFVEVRQRASRSHGGAAASVTIHKQRRLLRAAHAWLRRYPQTPACRIDVVAIDGETVQWLQDAVQVPD